MKRIAIALLLLCSTAEAAKPIKFRLYDSQAKPLVTNLTASQLHKADTAYAQMEVYMLSNLGLPSMGERATAVRKIGVPAVPGMRTFANNKIADYVSLAHWQKMADELEQVADMRVDGDRRVYIDHENYATGSEAIPAAVDQYGGRPAMEKAMMPFLEVIRRKKILPCMTPANADDIAEILCAEAAGESEWMGEDTFSVEADWRRGGHMEAVEIANRRRKILDTFPNATYCPGFFEEAIRDYNRTFFERGRFTFGEKDCWLFLLRRGDEHKIGTAEWLTGLSQSSLNDMTAPTFAENWINPTGTQLLSGHAGPKPRDPLFDRVYWPENRRFLLETTGKVGKVDSPFCLSFDAYVATDRPAAVCGLWHTDSRPRSWQVRYTDKRFHLDCYDAAGKLNWSAASVPAAVGTWQRVVVQFDGATLSLSSGSEAASVPKPRLELIPYFLMIGRGGAPDGTMLAAQDLRVKEIAYWPRALSAGELVKVRGGDVFPFEK